MEWNSKQSPVLLRNSYYETSEEPQIIPVAKFCFLKFTILTLSFFCNFPNSQNSTLSISPWVHFSREVNPAAVEKQ